MSEAVDLADRDVEVLELVVEHPDSTVTRLREMTYWADRNQHIHYRLDKLSDCGFVDTRKDPETETRGPLAPTRVSATEAGEEFLSVVETETPDDVDERLEVLEKRVDHWLATYAPLKNEMVKLREAAEERERRLDRLKEDVERLKHLREKEDDGRPSLGRDGFEFGG